MGSDAVDGGGRRPPLGEQENCNSSLAFGGNRTRKLEYLFPTRPPTNTASAHGEEDGLEGGTWMVS